MNFSLSTLASVTIVLLWAVSSHYVLIPDAVHLILLAACILLFFNENKNDAKDDPPHVKPVPISVIRRVFDLAATLDCPHTQCLADMVGLVFFFLLGPEEFTDSFSPGASISIKLRDVQLFHRELRLNLNTATDAQILSATSVTITFRNKKKGIREDNGDSLFSPTKILARRVLHLRHHNAPDDTPLSQVYTGRADRGIQSVTMMDITRFLQEAVAYLFCEGLLPAVVFLPSDISARGLRLAGANALRCELINNHPYITQEWDKCDLPYPTITFNNWD
jgi:hypothetical protein